MNNKTYQSTLNIYSNKSSLDKALKLYNQKKYNKALDICENELKSNHKNYSFLNIKALILKENKEYEKAIETFNKALKYTNNNEIKLNKANTLYLWAKQLHFPDYNNQKALTIIDEAIEISNNNQEFWFLKGEIYEGLGDNIEARKCYLKAEGKTDELKNLQDQIDLFDKHSGETLINITGYNHYKGINIFKKGVILNLIKDKDNEHDVDAIKVIYDDEIVGYVANSEYSLIEKVSSASDIKNLFDLSTTAEVLFIYLNELVICRLTK